MSSRDDQGDKGRNLSRSADHEDGDDKKRCKPLGSVEELTRTFTDTPHGDLVVVSIAAVEATMELREQLRVIQSLLDQTKADETKLRKMFDEALKTAAVTRRDTKEATDKATDKAIENSKEMLKKVKAEHSCALANEKKVQQSVNASLVTSLRQENKTLQATISSFQTGPTNMPDNLTEIVDLGETIHRLEAQVGDLKHSLTTAEEKHLREVSILTDQLDELKQNSQRDIANSYALTSPLGASNVASPSSCAPSDIISRFAGLNMALVNVVSDPVVYQNVALIIKQHSEL
jgi:hypothetical protein